MFEIRENEREIEKSEVLVIFKTRRMSLKLAKLMTLKKVVNCYNIAINRTKRQISHFSSFSPIFWRD